MAMLLTYAMPRSARRIHNCLVAVIDESASFAGRLGLASREIEVVSAGSVADLTSQIARKAPAVILLGRSCRFAEALDALRDVRTSSLLRGVPVLIFGNRLQVREETDALDAGADDFVDRSAATSVVLARIAALIRRAKPRDPPFAANVAVDADLPELEPVRVGAIEVDPGRHIARVDGAAVALTTAEFRLLLRLATNVGRVFSASQLANSAAHMDDVSGEHAVRSRIFCLRRKLGPAARQVQTIRNAGYRLVGE